MGTSDGGSGPAGCVFGFDSSDPGAAQQPAAQSASTLDAAKAAGKIRIGYANEAPYAYMDSKEARVTGESVEIARVVLKRMGIDEVEGVLTEFGSLIPGLQAKRFDIIAAGMYVTPERCQQVAFSDPTYGVGQAFLVQKGNPKNLHSYADVAKNGEAKLGVVVGAIEAEYATKQEIPAGQVVVFPDAVSALGYRGRTRRRLCGDHADRQRSDAQDQRRRQAGKGRPFHRSHGRWQERARLWRLRLSQG